MKVRRKITEIFFFGTGENINQSVWIVIERGRVERMRALRGEVWSKVEGKGRYGGVLKKMCGERVVRELMSSGGWAGQYATG